MFIKIGVVSAALLVGAQTSALDPPVERQRLTSAQILAYLETARSVPDHCVVVENHGSFCVYSGPGCPLFAPCL